MNWGRNWLIAAGIGMGAFIAGSCQDPFRPPATQKDAHVLVVEGFLNGPKGVTTIRLSRTAPLSTAEHTDTEDGAIVKIEGDDGSSFHLKEKPSGTYSADSLPVDVSRKYRVRITTSKDKEYVSDFVPFKVSPPIDSINWKYEGADIHIYVNTHDDNNNTHYYFWNYEATWAYQSGFYSRIKLVGDSIVQRDLSDDIFHCWKSENSTDILVGSSARLTRDVISNFELVNEPLTSQKFQSEYSLLVEQVPLTEEAYSYWQSLKKNTENVGTIFGPQPSQMVSNLHSVANPSEPVLGYFSAGSSTQQRSFIKYHDLPLSHHDTGYEGCVADTLAVDKLGSFSGGETLINEVFENLTLIGYLKATTDCVDCTYHGGSKVKPDFWQ